MSIEIAGVTYSTAQCRTEASAAAELAEAIELGLAHPYDFDAYTVADPYAAACEDSAAYAADWAEYLRLSEADDMQRGSGVLIGAASKGEN